VDTLSLRNAYAYLFLKRIPRKRGSRIMRTTEYNSTAALEISEYMCSHLSGIQTDK